MRSTDLLPRDYIELQLRFAAWLGHEDTASFRRAVLFGTNLFRRFRLGDPSSADHNAEWTRFVDGLSVRPELADRLDWAEAFADERRTAAVRGDADRSHHNADVPVRSGAFTADVSGGVLRLHFSPTVGTGQSPLHPDQLATRRTELATVVQQALVGPQEVRTVVGASWLYGTSGYCSLFPPSHIATSRIRTGSTRFQGSSSWGQFLDHHGAVKSGRAAELLERLEHIDTSTPWLAFPIAPRLVESPASVFVDHYCR